MAQLGTQNQQQNLKSLLGENTVKYKLIAILNYFQGVRTLENLFVESWNYKELKKSLTVLLF